MGNKYDLPGGKGSAPRKYSVDNNTFDNNWDSIFKQKDKKPELKRCKVCHGEGGSFDAGHWYECPACSEGEQHGR